MTYVLRHTPTSRDGYTGPQGRAPRRGWGVGVEDSNRGLTRFLLQTRDDKSIAAPKTVQAIQTRRGEDIQVWVLYSLTDRQTDISLLLEKRKKKKKQASKHKAVGSYDRGSAGNSKQEMGVTGRLHEALPQRVKPGSQELSAELRPH